MTRVVRSAGEEGRSSIYMRDSARNTRFFIGVFCLAIGPLLGQAPKTDDAVRPKAPLNGQIQLEGNALANAIVVIAPVKAGQGHYGVADAHGSFSIAEVTMDEDYTICVFSQAEDVVNPCVWRGHRVPFKLKADKKNDSLKIEVKKGVAFTIRVEDPDELLPSSRRPGTGSTVLVGVWAGGVFIPAQMIAERAWGFEYRIVVPKGEQVTPYAHAAGVLLVDENNQPVRPDRFVATVAGAKGDKMALRFRVARLSPEGN